MTLAKKSTAMGLSKERKTLCVYEVCLYEFERVQLMFAKRNTLIYFLFSRIRKSLFS